MKCGSEIENMISRHKKYCEDCQVKTLRKQRLEAQKRWQARNPRKVKEYQKKYYQDHYLEIGKKHKEYYENKKKEVTR